MASRPLNQPGELALLYRGFQVQLQVIGALLMRELHNRYDNIAYLRSRRLSASPQVSPYRAGIFAGW